MSLHSSHARGGRFLADERGAHMKLQAPRSSVLEFSQFSQFSHQEIAMSHKTHAERHRTPPEREDPPKAPPRPVHLDSEVTTRGPQVPPGGDNPPTEP